MQAGVQETRSPSPSARGVPEFFNPDAAPPIMESDVSAASRDADITVLYATPPSLPQYARHGSHSSGASSMVYSITSQTSTERYWEGPTVRHRPNHHRSPSASTSNDSQRLSAYSLDSQPHSVRLGQRRPSSASTSSGSRLSGHSFDSLPHPQALRPVSRAVGVDGFLQRSASIVSHHRGVPSPVNEVGEQSGNHG